MDGSSIPLAVMSIYGKAEGVKKERPAVFQVIQPMKTCHIALFSLILAASHWSVAFWTGKTGYSDS